MRIISQDGKVDIPYDYFLLSMDSGKFSDGEIAIIYCRNLSSPDGTKLARYSTKEKALKAMKMLREHNEGVAFLKTIINTEKGAQFVSALPETAFDKMTQNYFQFPRDDEIEA